MVKFNPLVLVPHILLCVVPPVDNIFGPLGSNLGCSQLRYVGLFCVWPSFLLLSGRPTVCVGDVVRVYLLFLGVVSVVLCILCGGGLSWGGGGAMVVSAWTSWRNFLPTLPPS